MIKYRLTLETGSCLVFFADGYRTCESEDGSHLVFRKNEGVIANISKKNVKKIEVLPG